MDDGRGSISNACDPELFEGIYDEAPAAREESKTPNSPGMTPCMWCEELVDEALFTKLLKGQRASSLRIRQQIKFCRMHTEETARNIWQENGYPSGIKWENLETRIREPQHLEYIESLIQGMASSSYFGALLQKDIEEKGNNENRRQHVHSQAEKYPSPGYYGPRGRTIMMGAIFSEFGNVLREKAHGLRDNNLIAAGSAPWFVQVVLVPELAVQLIREDMGLGLEDNYDDGEEKARQVMEESRNVGEILYDE